MSSIVTLQTGALAQLHLHIPDLAKYSQFVFFTHPGLMPLYGASVLSALQTFKRPILEIYIPEGEESKSLTQAKRCWQHMFSKSIDRQSAVIALGGGVICDLAGFVASCYMRGLDSFYLPTTLLAMVDATLGGKTGVNLPQAKNMIGTFHQPKHVVLDPTSLLTLPQREFNSGLAEMIKYGIISDPLLVEELEEKIDTLKNRQGLFLEQLISRCVSIKNNIVAKDEKDVLGLRAALNYGHTFAHAIEAVTKYQRFLHGEAVSMGMSCAVNLSARLGLCETSLVERQDRLCQRADLPTQLPSLSVELLIRRMKSDKKTVYGKLNFILLRRIGEVIKVCDIDSTQITQLLFTKMDDI